MIIVDLETTGLLKPDNKDPALQPGIVQIGLIKLDANYDIERSQSWLVNPEMPIEEDATKVHGIDGSKVFRAPTLPALHPEICEWFLGELEWVGFNNEFDRKVLYFALARYGLEARFPWPPNDLDVMKLAKPILNLAGKRDIKHPNLTECYAALHEGKTFAGAHDALNDCLATAACIQKLAEMGYV